MQENNYQNATISNYLSTIKTFLKFGTDIGYLRFPYGLIKLPKVDEHAPAFVSREEYEMIDELLDKDNFESLTKRLAFRLLWETGCRVGELVDINLEDIKNFEYCIITRQKSRKKNVLMWSKRTQKLLKKYVAIRLSLYDNSKNDALFPSRVDASKRITSRTIQRWVRELVAILDLDDNITCHSFRHGKAHKILSQSGRQEDVKAILGHNSIISSDRYTRLNVDEQRRLQTQYFN